MFFFFNDTATTEIYTLSLHDALPIWRAPCKRQGPGLDGPEGPLRIRGGRGGGPLRRAGGRVPRAHADCLADPLRRGALPRERLRAHAAEVSRDIHQAGA